jgi:hypothetical protein
MEFWFGIFRREAVVGVSRGVRPCRLREYGAHAIGRGVCL